ncbi:stalk domain-containing protein [Paenibacillus hamazuiensis]|uniref:stalk domain-containing protein n=1 Tax=Paenibacillus hamazuiensis TaxID=2936508 RepID=UPI00200D0712
MKKFVMGLLCGAALSMSTVVIASDSIQAILFPSKITFQVKGNQAVLDTSENPVLNYNNKTYIPLRAFAEAMGANVDFVSGSEAADHLNLITVSSNEYKLIQYGPDDNISPANAVYTPLGVGLGLPDEYRRNSDQLSIENTNNFVFSVINRTNDNLLVDPSTTLALEVYTAPEGVEDQLVYRYVIPQIPRPIPSRSSYTFTIPWNQTGSNGKKIEPGRYIVKLAKPENINYQVEGDSDTKSVPSYVDMRYGPRNYIVNYQ